MQSNIPKSYIILTFFVLFFQIRCTESKIRAPNTQRSNDSSAELARIHCSSCHEFPKPELLDKYTWTKSILPNMAARLGVKYPGYYPMDGMSSSDIDSIVKYQIYPDSAILSQSHWNQIHNYYALNAPYELPPKQKSIEIDSTQFPFSSQYINVGDSKIPKVTMVEFDPKTKVVFIGDDQYLYALHTSGNIVNSWNTQSPSVQITWHQDNLYLLSIGSIIPTDIASGVFFPLISKAREPFEVITSLRRPVHFDMADLNNDQMDDLILCEFGHNRGRLSWYDSGNNSRNIILNSSPGAMRTAIDDFNNDGSPDIIALMAQAWEGIDLYINDGAGNFSQKRLLSFPTVYGSSYFEVHDFNQDGLPDILLANGDNWDYSRIKKPYHGLRIFINQGDFVLKESFFYPMYGCSKAMSHDFDQDGDLDIVACAFYSPVDEMHESVVYLENQGNLDFTANYPMIANKGKWLCMDIGDFNQDSFVDVFLGSYIHNVNEMGSLIHTEGDIPQVVLMTYKSL